jgi:hypothetical protein
MQTKRDIAVIDDAEHMARYVIRAQKYAGEPGAREVVKAREGGISWQMMVNSNVVEVVRKRKCAEGKHAKHYIYYTNDETQYGKLLVSVERQRDRLLQQ